MMRAINGISIFNGFLSAIAIVALLLGGFSWWLLATTSGLRWATNIAPDILNVESIDGDVSGFSFNNLLLTVDGITVRIDRGAVQWSPFKLLSRRVSIDSLSLTGVEVELVEAEPTKTPHKRWQGLELPIDVSLTGMEINRISIAAPPADSSIISAGALDTASQRVVLSKIEVSADIDNSILDLKKLKISESNNRVSLQGKVDLSAKPDGVLDLWHTVDWQISQIKLESSGTINGTWSSIKIEQNKIMPLSLGLTATVENLLSKRIEWSAELVTAPREVQTLVGETVWLGKGEFTLKGDFLVAQGLEGLSAAIVGQSSIATANHSNWKIDVDVVLANDQLVIDTLSIAQIGQQSPASLSIAGQLSQVSSFLTQTDTSVTELGAIDIEGVWSSMPWPYTSPFESPDSQLISDGQLSVKGSSQRYTVSANAIGKAYAQDLKADLKLVLAGNVFEVQALSLVSGKSRLSASGRVDDRIDLSWSIASPDIGDFLAGGSGTLASTGKVTGLRAKPTVSMTADSKGLSLFGFSVDDLDLLAVASLATADDSIDVFLRASSITQDQKIIADRLSISIDGRVQSHLISLESTLANDATLTVKVKGSLLNDQWIGELSVLNLNDPVLAEWRLKNRVIINVASDVLSVSESCLINRAQSLCFEALKNAQSTQLSAVLTSLDLSNLNILAQLYDLNIKGQANGEFSYLKAPTQTLASINGYLQSTSAVLTWQESGDAPQSDETLVFESIRASIKQVDSLRGSIAVTLANTDAMTFDIDVDEGFESPTFMQAQVRGKAKLAVADLSVLPSVLLDAVSLNGALNADLELKGSLSHPEIIASGALKNARADIPELGLQLEGLELKLTSDGTSKVDLDGQLRSGKGQLYLSGNVDFLDLPAPKVVLVIKGENLQLADTPELNIIGDINLTSSLENQLLDLRGGVVLERAELDFKLPETAVLVSNDVVLKGIEKSVSNLKQSLNITVDLGNKTKISAKGLEANLSGQLLVFQQPGGILRGDGQITVNNGRYRAYGQDLKIDKGRLVFDGGSIDDPNLALKAEKKIDATTAGVSVTGRASSPRLNLYSSPSMQDEDILSILIFNKPVGNLASQDGFTLVRIANSLRGDGSSEVTKMTEKLQQSLGLTSLEFQLNNNALSVVAGKQFSSKFYIGYGYGLLDAAQSLILRYNLSDAWSIKADLGADSGADLRYQIER